MLVKSIGLPLSIFLLTIMHEMIEDPWIVTV